MPPKDKKPKPTGDLNKKTFEEVTYLLLGFVLLGALVTAVLNYIDALLSGVSGSWLQRAIDYFLEHIWPVWGIIAAVISVLAVMGIVRNAWKLKAINIEEQKIYSPTVPGVSDEEVIKEAKNKRWEKIVAYANSGNSADWRLAIIEADVMLEELLETAGYVGGSVGEMLKSVDKNEFLSIESAWEAHKIRNSVAHSGGNFQLNERETKRVIALFEEVFKEFGVI
ncbi:MAG: hypothetical protein AAB719_02040 [Patescibacteria group bacterium]